MRCRRRFRPLLAGRPWQAGSSSCTRVPSLPCVRAADARRRFGHSAMAYVPVPLVHAASVGDVHFVRQVEASGEHGLHRGSAMCRIACRHVHARRPALRGMRSATCVRFVPMAVPRRSSRRVWRAFAGRAVFAQSALCGAGNLPSASASRQVPYTLAATPPMHPRCNAWRCAVAREQMHAVQETPCFMHFFERANTNAHAMACGCASMIRRVRYARPAGIPVGGREKLHESVDS